MGDREDAFNQLLERQSTDGDRQRLYRARDTLNIKPTDAVWRLLMVLEYYQTMYEKIPHQIADAARNATETIRVTAEAQAKAAREETKKDSWRRSRKRSARQRGNTPGRSTSSG